MTKNQLVALSEELNQYVIFLRTKRDEKVSMLDGVSTEEFFSITNDMIDIQRDIDGVCTAIRIINRRILDGDYV